MGLSTLNVRGFVETTFPYVHTYGTLKIVCHNDFSLLNGFYPLVFYWVLIPYQKPSVKTQQKLFEWFIGFSTYRMMYGYVLVSDGYPTKY